MNVYERMTSITFTQVRTVHFEQRIAAWKDGMHNVQIRHWPRSVFGGMLVQGRVLMGKHKLYINTFLVETRIDRRKDDQSPR